MFCLPNFYGIGLRVLFQKVLDQSLRVSASLLIEGSEGSCLEWLLGFPTYLEWRASKSTNLLWHRQRPGSHDEQLLPDLFRRLLKLQEIEDFDLVSFQWGQPDPSGLASSAAVDTRSEAHAGHPASMILASIISQLFQGNHDKIEELIRSLKPSDRMTIGDPSSGAFTLQDSLWNLFKYALSSRPLQTTYILIGNIDLIGKHDTHHFLTQLGMLMRYLEADSEDLPVHFFITTSRGSEVTSYIKGALVADELVEQTGIVV